MAANHIAPHANTSRKPGVLLRNIGIVILLLGLAAAGLVYWLSTPPVDLSDDVSTAETSKKVQHDIAVNVGQMGVLLSELMDDFQDPGTQAVTIVIFSILAASGCFYFAHLQARDDQSNGPTT